MKSIAKRVAVVLLVLILAAAAYFLYDRFHVRGYIEKAAQITHLEDGREFTSELEGYIQDDDPRIRARAAMAIGRIGAPGSAKLLYKLVTTDDIDVAAAAVTAIGLTGDKEFAAVLLDDAFDYPARVSALAVQAAGWLADSSMTSVSAQLTGYLSHPSPEVREATCYALVQAGARDRGPELMDFIRSEPDEEVKRAALYAMSRLGVKPAQEIYADYLADSDPWIRSLAVHGIGLGEGHESIRFLMIALNDANRGVVVQTVRELSKKSDPDARKRLVSKLENENDELVRMDILDALGRQKNADALLYAKQLLDSTASNNIVSSVITYLATVEGDRAITLIDSLALLKSPQIRASCADAYGVVGNPSVASRLGVLFNDPNSSVRAAAFSSLTGVDAQNMEFYLNKALSDTDFVLQALALDKISSGKLKSYLPRMNEMMAEGSGIDVDTRRSLVEASAPFIQENKEDTAARQLLIKGILDPSYVVRLKAADEYKDLLGEDRYKQVPPAETRISNSALQKAFDSEKRNPAGVIATNKGNIEIELYFDTAPLTVLNFINVASSGFYKGIIFHRLVSNFVILGGDPLGTGWGGPGYFIRDEYSSLPFKKGTVGIATSGKDTGGSQFFITLSPQPHLVGRYTVFGQVISGMDVAQRIVPGDTIREVVIKQPAGSAQ